MIVETIVGALVPIGAEAIKQVVTKFSGGAKPTSVAEIIQLDQAEVSKLEALAKLDNPFGNPSQWVVDLRASSRYIGALGVIAAGIIAIFLPGLDVKVQTVALEAANISFGFLFGTRITAGWSKR